MSIALKKLWFSLYMRGDGRRFGVIMGGEKNTVRLPLIGKKNEFIRGVEVRLSIRKDFPEKKGYCWSIIPLGIIKVSDSPEFHLPYDGESMGRSLTFGFDQNIKPLPLSFFNSPHPIFKDHAILLSDRSTLIYQPIPLNPRTSSSRCRMNWVLSSVSIGLL